jgi:hypothetical protein
MAAETLLNISQDEKMRYIIMQEEKRDRNY